MTIKLTPYDTADFLGSDEMIHDFLEDALLDSDPVYLAHALGVVARARGMTKVAKEANLSRESLYKALGPNGNPALGTILRVLSALGMRLSIAPAPKKTSLKRKCALRSSRAPAHAPAKLKAKRKAPARAKA